MNKTILYLYNLNELKKEMKKEICSISIGKGILDDDYTFYEDGTIKRFYDQNQFKFNLEEWVTHEQIGDHIKQKLLDKCEELHKEQVRTILYPI